MASAKTQKAVAYLHIHAPWRRLLKNRTVKRNVQGTELYLPWSHRLPDYVRARPEYGQNLVKLAAALEKGLGGDAAGIGVLDIGANVGDSAAQIMHATSARVLCVEGDPFYLTYLHKNVDGRSGAAVEEVLLMPNEDAWSGGASPVRKGGTTHFVASEGQGSMPMLSVARLHDKHPDFDGCASSRATPMGRTPR